jgi:hypothetical protein
LQKPRTGDCKHLLSKGVEMTEDFNFEVGATYENMKGPYEVISIRKNEMIIRWEDGNEMTTTVELQKRIIERMTFEKESERRENQKKASSGKEKKGARKK